MILQGNIVNTIPRIDYKEKSGIITISGRSVSPEVEEHFNEFLDHLKSNLKKNAINITIIIRLEYFNTLTARALLKMFKIIKQYAVEIVVNWFYDEDDDDFLDAGNDFQEITKLNFNFIRN